LNLPDLSLVSLIVAVTGGGVTLFSACWVIFEALKREMPGIKRYLVRTVLVLALLFAVTARYAPEVFAILAAWVIVAALILGGNEMVKRFTEKPPDKPVP
jgi:hypothetical protein